MFDGRLVVAGRGGGTLMSGPRFTDDPLVTVSGQFPLSPASFVRPPRGEPPSGPLTRPFALRWLVDLGVPTPSESYRYCPVRQVAVHVRTGEPRPPLAKLEWTTVGHKDGDEGPSKDYDWEVVPDDD
jgi:putative ATP-grasp target RiPP